MATGVPAVLALNPAFFDGLFPPAVLARLRRALRLDGPWARLDEVSLSETEILITGWDGPRIDAAVLDRAPKLRAVIHSAGSVKHLVDPVVFERGLTVSSAALANARPVAEYTAAVLVLAAKRILPPAAMASIGQEETAAPEGLGLLGSVVGVVGASRIGRLMIPKLTELGARVLLADPYADLATAGSLGAELTGLDALCAASHQVTLHAPALPETRHLFDERRIGLLRDGAVLVNTARGSLIDHEALAGECATGRISAVLDVTDPEPLPSDHPLRTSPNVLITPHVAGACGRERRLLGSFVAAEVERLLAGQPLLGQIRLADLERSA
ncbi:hydroxyacid dehydrogenase [Streptomyces sp. FIT100]|uniref:hydroxyacid dehydrogenase n=1 Tax=Streptomyces sp. FIT100 TaxID=2837956 RepID=UPI0021C6E2BC|nr:hydroxyacid dehydrogenase [Streptomyces sp. FIT100]